MGGTEDVHHGWFVHLSVTAEDGRALLHVDPRHYPERGARLEPSADSDRKVFVLHSREVDRDRARDAVIDRYQRLRRVAGLDAEPARVVSLGSADRFRSRNRLDVTLMREARRALDIESNLEWAVVVAQTACETYVREILERKAAKLGPDAIEAVDALGGTNLANSAVRRVFAEITGYSPPVDATWWADYIAHVDRRHRVVHMGDRVTREQAEASLVAAEAMIGFLHWPSQSIDAKPA